MYHLVVKIPGRSDIHCFGLPEADLRRVIAGDMCLGTCLQDIPAGQIMLVKADSKQDLAVLSHTIESRISEAMQNPPPQGPSDRDVHFN